MKRSTLLGAAGGLLAGVSLAAVAFVAAPSWAFRDDARAAVAQFVSGQAVAPNITPVRWGQPDNLADLVEQVSPSVVQIIVHQGGRVRGPAGGFNPFEGFEQFRKRGDGDGDSGRQRTPDPMASGSGFIIDGRGYIVTNNHVVEDGSRVQVRFTNGEEVEADVVGTDERTDLAVLKVSMRNLPGALAWGDSNRARPGENVFAIGSPFGLTNTVTAGIISARGRDINSGAYDDFIQVDVPINQGNSGGPLFNAQGQVIGVNSAIYSPTGGNVGIGFSIPADLAKSIVDQIIANGSVERGWLGVSIEGVNRPTAASLNLPEPRGALVQDVTAGGPAARAGLRQGDVILSFGDVRIDDTHDLTRAVAETRAGQTRDLKVFRDGREQTIRVTIADLKDADNPTSSRDSAPPPAAGGNSKSKGGGVSPSSSSEGVDVDVLGLELRDIGGFVVVSDIDARSTAFEAGIQAGDRVIRVGQAAPANAQAAARAIAEAKASNKEAILLQIERVGQDGSARRIVGVPFPRR